MPFSEGQEVGHPLQFYAATKRANELMAHSYAHLFALPCTGSALLHRLRPLGPARHGADDLRRRDQRREAAPAVQRRRPQPRLHLRRGHRRGGGAGVRRHRDARSGLGPGGPRSRHLGGAVPDLQHRQRRPGPAPRLHRRARAGARANRRSPRTCRRSPATCPTPGPTAPGSRPPPAGGPRPRSRTASPASPPGTATTSAGNCPDGRSASSGRARCCAADGPATPARSRACWR